MSQVVGFNAVVVNGSNVVRAVWNVVVGTVTGTFVAGESLKWPGSGGATNGKFLSAVGSGDHFFFYMTVDTPEPVVGNQIFGVTSTATATITLLEPVNFPTWCGNPPRFADSPEQGTILTNDLFFIEGQPYHLVGATIDIKRASFKLSANWGGSTFDETTVGLWPQGRVAGIHRDLTPILRLAMLQAGDKFSADAFTYNMRILDNLAVGSGSPPTAWSALTLTSPWLPVSGEAVPARSYYPATDTVRLKGLIHNSTTVSTGAAILSGGNVLPSGVRPSENLMMEVGGGETIKIATTGGITYEGPGGLCNLNLNSVEFRADGS